MTFLESHLYWYKFVFMAELIIAEILFSFRLKRKPNFVFRVFISLVVCFVAAFLFPMLNLNALYLSVMFLVLFAVSVFMLKFCFDEKWNNVIFCAIAAYTAQHLAYEICNYIVLIAGLNEGLPLYIYGSVDTTVSEFLTSLTIVVYIYTYIIVYWAVYMIFGKRIKKNEDLDIKNVATLTLVGLIVLIDIVLNAIVVYRSYTNLDKVYYSVVFVYNTVCCIMALTMQFSLLSKKKIEKELSVVNQLLHQEKKHYDFSKENIDLINLKCHDLKHQIRKYGEVGALSEESIKEMESIISIYDLSVKTGNETLDIILTEKSLLCKKHNIKLTCIADGEKLNFMSDVDIYSLFGNAIDNAIEAVLGIEENKRVIGLLVKTEKDFLSLQIYNYFNFDIKFQDGLPITSKSDSNYHGFGLKSIKLIVEKYGGNISIALKDNIFNLNILFSL